MVRRFVGKYRLFVSSGFRGSPRARWRICAVVTLVGRKARIAARPARFAAAPKRVEPFYKSKEWLALVALRKRDADYFAALGRAKAKGERVILDHVTERKDGGADLEAANTQWLTHSEHQAKTARAKRARLAGE